jgi:methanogenic corrinoid protein MtbC1
LVTALLDGAEDIARQIAIDLYLAGHPISTILDDVLAPAFRDIGDRWECGAAEVYQERRACEICLHVLYELEQAVPTVNAGAPVAVGCTTEFDPYHLATTMAAVVLRENGWQATSLGTMLPTTTIVQAIKDMRPRLVWMSFSHITDETALQAVSEQLYEAAIQQGAALVVGGRALTAEFRRSMKFSAYCDTMHHLESFADSILAAGGKS